MEDFLKFVAQIFNVQPEELSMDAAYGQYPAWDSLKHLRLVTAAEEEYDITIPMEAVGKIKTLRDLYDLCCKSGNE